MSDTPDLSRIVNMILENPTLVEEISKMARSEMQGEPEGETAAAAASAQESVSAAADYPPMAGSRAEKRGMLISALKPYLSESRAKAIDSMVSVAQMLEIMKPR